MEVNFKFLMLLLMLVTTQVFSNERLDKMDRMLINVSECEELVNYLVRPLVNENKIAGVVSEYLKSVEEKLESSTHIACTSKFVSNVGTNGTPAGIAQKKLISLGSLVKFYSNICGPICDRKYKELSVANRIYANDAYCKNTCSKTTSYLEALYYGKHSGKNSAANHGRIDPTSCKKINFNAINSNFDIVKSRYIEKSTTKYKKYYRDMLEELNSDVGKLCHRSDISFEIMKRFYSDGCKKRCSTFARDRMGVDSSGCSFLCESSLNQVKIFELGFKNSFKFYDERECK